METEIEKIINQSIGQYMGQYIEKLVEANNKILDFYIKSNDERMDRHSLDQKSRFEMLMLKLDNLERKQAADLSETQKNISEHRGQVDSRIHKLELQTLNNNYSLGLKLATLTGNIGTLLVVLQILKLIPGGHGQ